MFSSKRDVGSGETIVAELVSEGSPLLASDWDSGIVSGFSGLVG